MVCEEVVTYTFRDPLSFNLTATFGHDSAQVSSACWRIDPKSFFHDCMEVFAVHQVFAVDFFKTVEPRSDLML